MLMAGELILIVEDERDLAQTLAFTLEREGYVARVAHDGASALELSKERPDLVLLDLMLPDMPGTEVCRRLRQQEATRQTPIIMVTARGEEIDRVVGFEVGADDYVVKPYSLRELSLRVRAVLQRTKGRTTEELVAVAASQASVASELEFGALRIDPEAHRVFFAGEEIVLTALEFKLLATFMERRGRVQTREVLLQDVWEIQANVMTRTVDTHVKRLREKLGDAGAYIETLRGVGYGFKNHPSEDSQETP
jgi:two-component system phosphate regulon response regulator PhoB